MGSNWHHIKDWTNINGLKTIFKLVIGVNFITIEEKKCHEMSQ